MKCRIEDLGIIAYTQAYRRQKECVEEILRGEDAVLLLCEHPPVLTLGRLTKRENILWPREEIIKKGFEIVPIDRGGDITLHSPGQLVVYPIFDLKIVGKDLKRYLRQLEEVVIDLLKEFDIVARRFLGQTGVWVQDKKIASMGIGVKKWISFHGVGLNVSTDLNLFSLIRPCGLNVTMTSLENIKQEVIPMAQVKSKMVEQFKEKFNLECHHGKCYSA